MKTEQEVRAVARRLEKVVGSHAWDLLGEQDRSTLAGLLGSLEWVLGGPHPMVVKDMERLLGSLERVEARLRAQAENN